MPSSMTGFAREEAILPSDTLVWEVRSVNHRYLEPHFRLPEALRELEPKLREQLRQRVCRGKVEASLSIRSGAEQDAAALTINTALVQKLAALADTVSASLANPAPVNPLELLDWPGVLCGQEQNQKLLLEQGGELFAKALATLIEHRRREGEELQNLIEQRLDAIKRHVASVREKMPVIIVSQRQKLLEKLEALQLEIDRDRLEQELVYLAQKSDIDEELDRLDTHVAEVSRTLQQSGSIGRRLDFLMQELNREANTLSSKSIVTDTTQAAVDIKVLIEQMREQVQNIE